MKDWIKKCASPRRLVASALIAALYAMLTLLLAPLSYGQVQLRVSEALTLLPTLSAAAVPGLFVGCLLANLLAGQSALDIVFGSLATLLSAVLTRALRRRPVLAALPPIIVNALVVGAVLHFAYGLPLWASMGYVAAGQSVACLLLGLPLMRMAKRLPRKMFPE